MIKNNNNHHHLLLVTGVLAVALLFSTTTTIYAAYASTSSPTIRFECVTGVEDVAVDEVGIRWGFSNLDETKRYFLKYSQYSGGVFYPEAATITFGPGVSSSDSSTARVDEDTLFTVSIYEIVDGGERILVVEESTTCPGLELTDFFKNQGDCMKYVNNEKDRTGITKEMCRQALKPSRG